MGEYFQRIVDLQATDEEADELGASILAWLVDSGIVEAACRAGSMTAAMPATAQASA